MAKRIEISMWWIEGDYIYTKFTNGEIYRQPLSLFPTLRNADPKDWMLYEISSDGLHWRKIDEDISAESFITEGKGPLLYIINTDYIAPYRLRVTFSDDVVKEVDFADRANLFAGEGKFGFSEFEMYSVDRGNIHWSNGVSFPVSELYAKGVTIENKPCERSQCLADFFRSHEELNVSGVARKIGINATLLSNYIHGRKIPSEQRLKDIESGLRKLGLDIAQSPSWG